MVKPVHLGILASGSGSNAEAIIKSCENGRLKGKTVVSVLISDNPDAYCLERAIMHNIPAIICSRSGINSREEHDRNIVTELKKWDVELVVLAGYMRLISSYFLQEFPHRVINIHPALLPSFRGMHGYKDAVEYGVKITGITVHFVDDQMDHGPIILQKSLEVVFEDTEETLKERGLKLEHEAFPEAIELYCEDRLEIIGRKVKIKPN
ncbi:MAG: phosphoribosylglycinamide formyltransferase [Candidatus Lokiarchaeota archaeon]|nr:phosphoribosylglycinamide formyltransferase [Candidatus Lokiarchaeota archaeon]